MKSWFWLFLTLFVACHGQRKVVGEMSLDDKKMTSDYAIELLIQDNYGGAEQPETLVINNQKSLQDFFSKINRTRKPGLPVPQVDFSKNLVLIYCPGSLKGGNAPKLGLFEESKTALVFKPTVDNAIKTTGSTAQITPFSVYKIPLTSKEISFKGIE